MKTENIVLFVGIVGVFYIITQSLLFTPFFGWFVYALMTEKKNEKSDFYDQN